MKKIYNFIPISLLFLLSFLIYWTGLYQMISFDTLREHHKELREIVLENKVLAPVMFVVVFALSIAFSIPGGFFLSLFSGFLFSQPWGLFYVLAAVTLGSVLIFLAVKTVFKAFPKEKGGPWLQKMEQGFRKNATYYMLSMRLIPYFPFWFVNCLAAFCNLSIWTYIWTTFLGMVPLAFLYTYAGSKLNMIFETKKEFSFASALSLEGKMILVCLGLSVLIPILVKNIRARKKELSKSE